MFPKKLKYPKIALSGRDSLSCVCSLLRERQCSRNCARCSVVCFEIPGHVITILYACCGISKQSGFCVGLVMSKVSGFTLTQRIYAGIAFLVKVPD